MHELSLALSAVKLVEDDARQRSLKRVNSVRLIIGRLAMADPDVLSFALAEASRGTMLDDARFEVVMEEPLSECPACQITVEPQPPFYTCPKCGRGLVNFEHGLEVRVDFYEGE